MQAQKPLFEGGAESGFCLWQELKNVNQKIAQEGEDLDFYSEMVRNTGLEPVTSRMWIVRSSQLS